MRESIPIPPRSLRALTTPLDWVLANQQQARIVETFVSLPKICLKIRGKSILRQGDREATARCEPRFRMLSSNGTTPEVDQATHTEAFGNLPQFHAAGAKNGPATDRRRSILDLKLPTLGAQPAARKTPASPPRSKPIPNPTRPERLRIRVATAGADDYTLPSSPARFASLMPRPEVVDQADLGHCE